MVEAQHADHREDTRDRDELLRDIPRRVRLPSPVTPERALTAVICTLMQHALGPEAHYVTDALPKTVRPVLERCGVHRDMAPERFGRTEMIRRVADHLSVSLGDAEDISAAVVTALGLRLRPSEVPEVASHMPLELRDLWAVRRSAAPVDPHPVLEQIESTLDLPYPATGMGAFAAVMSTLAQRLPLGEATYLVEQLPMDLRPLVSDALEERAEDPELFDRDELFARVGAQLDIDEVEPVVRAVFRSVQEYLRSDAFEHVMTHLPRDIEELWVVP
jgi:uncharacterized protein (DUF2267 family)